MTLVRYEVRDGIAHVTLGVHFLRVAHAAEDLQGLVGDPAGHLGRVELGHAGLQVGPLA